jgi:hypothetical protein
VNPRPAISFTVKNETTRKINFTPSDTTYTSYSWDFGDGSNSNDIKASHTYNVLKGKFNVTLTVTNKEGCSNKYSDTAYVGAVGIQDNTTTLGGLKIFPNPFGSATNLSFELLRNTELRIELTDIVGKKLGVIDEGSRKPGLYEYEVNAADFNMAAGIYLIRIQAGNATITRQLILSR